MLAVANRCGVCGWEGTEAVCRRCGTILLKDKAFCPRCGKMFDGPVALCDACGGSVKVPEEPPDEESIARLSHLPGVDEATAKRLHARGFRDPADVLSVALPERAVRLGLHRALARRLTVEELRHVPQVKKTLTCPTCGAARNARDPRCSMCGAPWEREPDAEELKKTLEEVVGEVHDLTGDPDFKGLPDDMREEILEAVEGAGFDLSEESEFSHQFKEWRARGFDTTELEKVLREEGSEAFKAQFVRNIRSQLLKRRDDSGEFTCPICDKEVSSTAEVCDNCGAKFR